MAEVSNPTNSSQAKATVRPLAKKPKLQDANLGLKGTKGGQHHLARIPLELLAEILSFAASPRDILAVSRCDKYLCATLLRKSSDFIWRQARRNCKGGGVPDPTSDWSEAAYAAWLFYPGVCEVCKKTCKAVHISFALRVRLCGNVVCHLEYGKSLIGAPPTIAGDTVTGWLISVESGAFLNAVKPYIHIGVVPADDEMRYPTMERWYRKTDLEPAITAFESAKRSGSDNSLTGFLVAHEAQAKKMPIVMENAVALQEWRAKYTALSRRIHAGNEHRARTIATKEGWLWSDLKVTQTFNLFLRAHDMSLDEFTREEFERIRPQVEAEMIRLIERRRRQQEEKEYAENRARVALHYQRMKSAGTKSPMPSLTEFHRLPVIKALQSAAPAAYSVDELLRREPFMKDMLEKDLEKWREKAKTRLAEVLGFKDWKIASKKKLHPVERVTARFICKLCQKVAKRHQEFGSLDFRGACEHKCPHLDKKQRGKYVWTAEQFLPDEKAIKAISQAVALTGNDPETASTFNLADLNSVFMCLSCDAAIIMHFDRLCMHSKRHEDMQLKLLSLPEANAILKCPTERGLHAKLMAPSYQAKNMRALKEYGCRHCVQKKEAPPEAIYGVHPNIGSAPSDPPSGTAGSAESGPSSKTASAHGKLWDFNGLRSHAKAKHGIETLGDEDFYRYTPPETHS